MILRKFSLYFASKARDYQSEFVFGIVLLIGVLLSYWVAHFISIDFYSNSLTHIMNGCNFYQFVTNYRIEEAKRLMEELTRNRHDSQRME